MMFCTFLLAKVAWQVEKWCTVAYEIIDSFMLKYNTIFPNLTLSILLSILYSRIGFNIKGWGTGVLSFHSGKPD